MKTWWFSLVDTLRSSFWFVPACMAAVSAALAVVLMVLDYRVFPGRDGALPWLHAGDVKAVRDLLSAVLSTTITVLSVVFSITVVALTLASNQFGPRLLRNFMQNRGTQVTLGTFVATCLYCVLVLGSIGRFSQEAEAPRLAAVGALLLALASLGILVYFIHHIARSIQAPSVIATAAGEIDRVISRWYPDEDACEPIDKASNPPAPLEEAAEVRSPWSNYVEAVDFEALMRLAEERGLVIRLRVRAGDFLVRQEVIADVWPKRLVDESMLKAVRKAFILGTNRTPTQDVEFAIDQLVEIAVRSMSPSINDPFTAITCVDRLTDGLSRLARCRLNQPYHRDRSGTIRLYALTSTFAGVVNAACNKIRQNSRDSAALTIHLLEALRIVAHHTVNEEQRGALRRQGEMIHRGAMEALPEPEDRRDATDRYERLLESLERARQSPPREPVVEREPAELRA